MGPPHIQPVHSGPALLEGPWCLESEEAQKKKNQSPQLNVQRMFSLMSKAEKEKHAQRQHHNRRHGNSRMKEPVPMEIRAAAHRQENGEGGSVLSSWFSNSDLRTVKMSVDPAGAHQGLRGVQVFAGVTEISVSLKIKEIKGFVMKKVVPVPPPQSGNDLI